MRKKDSCTGASNWANRTGFLFVVVKIVKIVHRVAGAELDALDLLQIDIKDLLGIGSCAAKAHTVKGFLDRIPQVAIEKRRL